MPIEVVLDIFSGRPNPIWVLSGDQGKQWLSYMEALQPASEGDGPEPAGLGYRGILVKGFKHTKCGESVRVFGGVVQCADRKYLDDGRQLEKWLLATAGPSLDDSLREIVEEQI